LGQKDFREKQGRHLEKKLNRKNIEKSPIYTEDVNSTILWPVLRLFGGPDAVREPMAGFDLKLVEILAKSLLVLLRERFREEELRSGQEIHSIYRVEKLDQLGERGERLEGIHRMQAVVDP
jgi:hypothetical protein